MSALSANEWSLVRDALDDLLDRAPAERRRILSAMPLSPGIRHEIDTLLNAATDAADFMEVPPALSLEAAGQDYRSLAEGARVGQFRVERLVGRGGHGEVYEAFRDDGQFEQRVALKLLRPEAVSRFDAFRFERQVLANLEHKGISRLIDGGIAPDGRPYTAMEFVEGEAIDISCSVRGLDIAAILNLMLALCDAVAHAHGRLVVHGDIKPGNVLVDATGQPRLLDFGIARILTADTALRGLTTALSTPDYAAPEQLAGHRATVATDVYALGVLLYELLARATPWRVGDTPVSWATRLLHDEPPLMSSKAVPERKALLRGDLDAIVAKSVRADPMMRYQTVQALQDDITRHLTKRPVLARNGSSIYRLRRFAARNTLALSAMVLVVVTGVIGGGATLSSMRDAETGRAVARAEAGRVETLRATMDLVFRASADQPETGVTTRQLLDLTADQLRNDVAAGVASPDLLRQMGELYIELEEFSAAATFLDAHLAAATAAGDVTAAAQARQLLAVVAIRRGDLAGAEDLLSQSDAVWEAMPSRFTRELIQQRGIRAALLRQQGDTERALSLIRDAVDEATAAFGPDGLDTLALRQNLATHLLSMRQTSDARAEFDALAMAFEAAGRANSPAALAVMMHRGLLALEDGNPAEADQLLSQAVETRRSIYGASEALAALQLNHARVLLSLGEANRAVSILDDALEMSNEATGGGGMIGIMLLQSRGLARLTTHGPDAARADMQAALAAAEQNFGPESLIFGSGLAAAANVELFAGNAARASTYLQRARSLFLQLGPAGAHQMQVVHALEEMMGVPAERATALPLPEGHDTTTP
ncbi:serine/threonine-protein kinase [Roseicyclus mahoneyensis]|uniref:Non-specific serine/threonine protein kinase/serine/threonine-protein kinase n=1 Tax=Roseicyclus mahoneyensis TaxID=164332 RepID=A0A316GJR3_9RHOB|nr:serine/threonine-protein kinase [Roseicyclus mahoneyensis]PWK61348.1 non-specific serine/threonine protein kinase/serine/threonine-protein kinase [Roseicyclus mahoneyensis]